MENKKIILSNEIAKLAVARNLTITDMQKSKRAVCFKSLNFQNYQILSSLLISCQSASVLKRFDDSEALKMLKYHIHNLRNYPDYRQADFLSSQGEGRHCITSLDYAEQLIEQILADNIAW